MTMIQEQALFASVLRRLFTGRVQELLGELLQNSQRAGARRVDITFHGETVCIFEDDGHGLVHGMSDLRNALVVAESFYPDGRVRENQAPMGVGLYALIAHEAVSRITIESDGLSFSLETQRWLIDEGYRESWEERVELRQYPTVPGFRLTIEGRKQLMEQLRERCTTRPSLYDLTTKQRFEENYNPISGYADVMDVYLDGVRLVSSLPSALRLPAAPIVTTYQGNTIHIAPAESDFSGLIVNWFGQIILDPQYRACRALRTYLVVREGQPVTPQAPTRTALMQNEALEMLYTWMIDQAFKWVCTQPSPEPWAVKWVYSIDEQRAERTCPFVVLRQWKPLQTSYQFSSSTFYSTLDLDTINGETDQMGPEQVYRKSDLEELLVLDEEVVCLLPGSHYGHGSAVKLLVRQEPERTEEWFTSRFPIGLTSFLPEIKQPAYYPVIGVPKERIVSFWWKPGSPVDDYHTIDLGEWSLVPTLTHRFDGEPCPGNAFTWNPVEGDQIFVADGEECWDVTNVCWIIGLRTTNTMVEFLRRCGWVPFMEDDDNPDSSEAAYEESLVTLIVCYLKDTIERTTSVYDLPSVAQRYLPEGYDAHKATWSFVDRPEASSQCVGVRLQFADGYAKELSFYQSQANVR